MEFMYLLPENLTIYNVKEIRKELMEYSQKTNECTLDAKDLKDIDGSGLQLLLSLYQSCEMRGRHFKLINRGEELAHLLDISGVTDILA